MSDNKILLNLYFDMENKNNLGEYMCRRCENYYNDNSGHGNLISHIKLKHKDEWQEKLNEAKYCNNNGVNLAHFGVTITKSVSKESKSMFGWIELIVMRDLPLKIVDDDLFRNYSNLLSTSYKTLSKYMTKLNEMVKASIKKNLPKSFGIIFDGCFY